MALKNSVDHRIHVLKLTTRDGPLRLKGVI